MNNQFFPVWQTPVGWIGLAGGTSGIEEIVLNIDASAVRRSIDGRPLPPELVSAARKQIDEYFAGQRRFFDLPLIYPVCSPFASRILDSLREVPFGSTITYGELARLSGHPQAARAVGGVMARNLFPLVIPCHRVIGAGGKMTGYSGGCGIPSKEWLLRFESEPKEKRNSLQ